MFISFRVFTSMMKNTKVEFLQSVKSRHCLRTLLGQWADISRHSLYSNLPYVDTDYQLHSSRKIENETLMTIMDSK